VVLSARFLPFAILACVGCGPGLREEPKDPVFFPGTDHEVRCDDSAPVAELMDLPRCSSSTGACVRACDDDSDCIYDCLIEDQTPSVVYKPFPQWHADCADCYYDALEHCGAQVCGELQKTFYCCWAEHGCGEQAICSPCETQGYAYNGCMMEKGLACLDQGEVLKCFSP
jgi:hypothetical protein